MNRSRSLLTLVPLLLSCSAVRGASAPPSDADPLPVREVTVFKDGHAFVMRESAAPMGADGSVVLDELPAPLMGAFWPYATGGGKLVEAKASRDDVKVSADATDLAQWIEANLGRRATLKDHANEVVTGVLRAAPKRDDGAPPTFVIVDSDEGSRAVKLDHLRWVQVEGQSAQQFERVEPRERLTLRIEDAGPSTRAGVAYVQRGLRWIPSYKLDLDGAGRARVQMQATLVNDLIDLNDATVHLVIGAPHFEFEGLTDPISMQHEIAAVAAQAHYSPSLSNMLSNTLMTQTGVYGAFESAASQPAEQEKSSSNEDLFVFSVSGVTLAVGERLVLPLREFELSYRDVYTLDVVQKPPMGMRNNLGHDRLKQLTQELEAPRARRVVRLKNTSDAPLTTAPALVLSRGRVLAQGRMTYTPPGVESDLELHKAVDVCVEVDEQEVTRTQDELVWRGGRYPRFDMQGSIRLRNEKDVAIEIEVTRRLLGLVDGVEREGTFVQLDPTSAERWSEHAEWWSWWAWPYWWLRFNGFAEVRWKLRLESNESVSLDASWHYFWN